MRPGDLPRLYTAACEDACLRYAAFREVQDSIFGRSDGFGHEISSSHFWALKESSSGHIMMPRFRGTIACIISMVMSIETARSSM